MHLRGNDAAACSPPPLSFRELQLDPPVAPQIRFGVTRRERLELAEARRGQPVRRHAFADQVFRNRDGTGGRKLQFDLKVAVLIGRMSVWPSTRSTQLSSFGMRPSNS